MSIKGGKKYIPWKESHLWSETWMCNRASRGKSREEVSTTQVGTLLGECPGDYFTKIVALPSVK